MFPSENPHHSYPSSSDTGIINIVSEHVFNFNFVILYAVYTSLFCSVSLLFQHDRNLNTATTLGFILLDPLFI